jgi:hypothetical protein
MPRAILLVLLFLLSSSGLSVAFVPAASAAPAGRVRSGLDCNGFADYGSENVKPNMICADPINHVDNGYYIGHDEPTIQFVSSTAGSANNLQYSLTLPATDPVPKQDGSQTANFENYVAFWFSLSLCDPHSFPFGACTTDSDANNPNSAGSALLELQFYPPGWEPLINQISCTHTQWCAAVNIDSYTQNSRCTEPVNFALIQTNGVPAGPPGPGQQTGATFTPNANTLFMNPGDALSVTIQDTDVGLKTTVNDASTGASGFMVASGANGFRNTSQLNCATSTHDFHPEYSSAAVNHITPWTALSANVNFAMEIGHFQLNVGGGSGDGDSDDSPCFSGPNNVASSSSVGGCAGADIDFDGTSYLADWADASAQRPGSFALGAPLSFSSGSYSASYPSFVFATDVPASDGGCNQSTGAGCKVPPGAGAFYPFYSTNAACNFMFGNEIAGQTVNDYGKDSEYGSPSPSFKGTLKGPVQSTPICASPGLALDGSGQCHAPATGSSCTVSITSSLGPDVIYCTTTQYYQNTAVSITNTAGLTFNPRFSVVAGHIVQKGWYAIASGTLSSAQITDTETGSSSTDDASMVCFGVSGANTNSPFDPNVSLPASETQSQGSGVTFSTSNAKDLLIVVGGDSQANVGIGASTGWTLIQDVNQGSPDYPYDLAIEYEVVSSTQTNLNTFFDQYNSQSNSRVNVADAIQQGGIPLHATTTTITPNPASVNVSGMVTFTATVVDSSESPLTPTGGVAWNDGGKGGGFNPASCTLSTASSSSSTCTTTYTAPATSGPVTVTGTYAGDPTHASSSGMSSLTVNSATGTGLALDGSGQCHEPAAGTSCTITLTSSHANLVCVTDATYYFTDSPTLPSDSAGNTFHQRFSHTAGHILTQEYYFTSTSALSSDVLTFHDSSADDASAIAFCVSGANMSSPFDNGAGLPTILDQTSGNTLTFSTSNANDFLRDRGGRKCQQRHWYRQRLDRNPGRQRGLSGLSVRPGDRIPGG